jgi:ABC-type sugar transport system ATPase subunit
MLDLRGIGRRFESTVALQDISFQVGTAEALSVRGPSGSGKTTLLRLIAGLVAPDSGEIWLHGARASCRGSILPPYRRNLAFVFQEPRLWPHMTVRQNVMFALAAHPAAEREVRFEKISQYTGIQNFLRRYPAEISVGQARRVALARALAPKRPLVLMDEPLANLDQDSRHELTEVIRRFWMEERFALIYVTHDASDETSFAQRTIHIKDGRLQTF